MNSDKKENLDKDRIKFYSIFPEDIPYFSYKQVKDILQNIPTESSKYIDKYNIKTYTFSLWNIEGVRGLFLKGLNPSTSMYILASLNLLEASLKTLDKRNRIIGIEYGTGAGWATVMLWKKINKLFPKLTIYSIDSSPYAVATTKLMLDLQKIPNIVIKEKELEQNADFNGVVLFINDFVNATKLLPKI